MRDGNAAAALSDECFLEYLETIHSLTGITISKSRKSMVQGRIRKRVKELGLAGFSEYLAYLKKTVEEKTVFIDLITTNETYFFRTPRVWDFIETHFLPEWYKKNPGQKLRAWSAASSSGEEAHSLGIVCQEFKSQKRNFSYEIVGTDISQEMVSLGSAGCYSGRSIESFQKLRPDVFKKYLCETSDDSFQVIPEIRSHLKFQSHNLFNEFKTKDKFDLVLLRNVLIYFTQPDQEKVLRNISPLVKDDGFLIIGESETLNHIQTDFRARQPLIYAVGERKQRASEAA